VISFPAPPRNCATWTIDEFTYRQQQSTAPRGHAKSFDLLSDRVRVELASPRTPAGVVLPAASAVPPAHDPDAVVSGKEG
jgi:hypothetical protein